MSIFSKIAVTDEERAAKAKEVMSAIASFSKQRNIDPEKALLLAGGSMYFRGLKDEMNDIDFTHPGLKDFTKQTIGKYELDGGPGGMPADAYASDKVYGLNVQKPEAILAFYKFLNRPKDQQKIQLLNSLLNPNATDETTKSASAQDLQEYLYSYVPRAGIAQIKEHGLLSGNELAKPENRHLLELARPNGDADRWLKEKDERLAKDPWLEAYNGPSVLFGDLDPDKIHNKHPIKKFDAARIKIKLTNLLKDYPDTRMEGSELIPYTSHEAYDALDEKGKDEFVHNRHHTLSPEEIKALIVRGQNPKDMWKDFKDTEGKFYASNVPHAHLITSIGKIPSKYIEFDEEQPPSKLVRYTHGGEGTWRKTKSIMDKLPPELVEKLNVARAKFHRPDLDPTGEYESYFTEGGAKKYEDELLPLHRQALGDDIKRVEIAADDAPAVYADDDQRIFTKQMNLYTKLAFALLKVASAQANAAITKDEARALALKYGGEIEDDWVGEAKQASLLSKLAAAYTASGEAVQGVGLRKMYHSLLEEQGLPGLAVNNEETGDVELSFDGDEAKRKEVFDQLNSRVKAKTGHSITFTPTANPQVSVPVNLSNRDAEKLNAIHHLAYRMSNLYDPNDSAMDSNNSFKEKIADRFRLQVNQRGLQGTVPSRASEQLSGNRPMYDFMLRAQRARSEEEALSDMPKDQKRRLMKALLGGRGFLDPNQTKVAENKAPELASKFIAEAELMGSRGRALTYGRPEPEDRDHDYIAFTDNAKKQEKLKMLLAALSKDHGYKLKQRDDGGLTASGNNTDLSVYPKSKRKDIYKSWALQEDGMSKDDAWAKINSKLKNRINPTLVTQINDKVAALLSPLSPLNYNPKI